jgi:hypothetical protein
MFGQKDDKNDNEQMQAVNDGANQLLASEPGTSDPVAGSSAVASATTAPPADVISPAGGYPSSPNDRITPGGEPETLPEPTLAYTPDSSAATTNDTAMVSNDDVGDAQLIDIKHKALTELIPLIDKLDQPPPEKFRTIMMMIQSSDDPRLVEKAYESAHAIEDEEARAQALLDIVNEINYFIQHPEEANQATTT